MSRIRITCLVFASLVACGNGASDDTGEGEQHVTASAPAPIPLPQGYESRTAEEKLRIVWDERILPTQYTTTLAPCPFGGFDLLKRLTAVDLEVSMSRTADEMPAGRQRLVHSVGSVVQIEFIPDASSPYTGM